MIKKLVLLSIMLLLFFSYPQQIEITMDDFIQYLFGSQDTITVVAKADIEMKGETVISDRTTPSEQVAGWSSTIDRDEWKGQFFTSSSLKIPIRRGALPTYRQIGFLERGQIFMAEESHTNIYDEIWIKINNGKISGWVPLDKLELFEGETNYLNKDVFTNKDTQVRREASFNERVTHNILEGTKLTLLSTYKVENETWYRVKEGEKSGWVHQSDLTNEISLSTDFYINHQDATIRRGADISYEVVSDLRNDQKVRATTLFINSKNEIWYKVILGDGKDGWIIGTSLSAVTTDKKTKVAFLTIDDGPTSYTNELLDILQEYNAKATFFMMDGSMKDYQYEVKRMVAEGHALGAHSVTHDKKLFYHSPSSALNEMMITRNTIEQITGINTNLMRVPYGSNPYMKKSYREAVNNEGFIMWDWNVDSLDWKLSGPDYVEYTLKQVREKDSRGEIPIILIHDRKTTIDHLPSLLTALEDLGYTLASLTEEIEPYQFKVKD
ncbi:polysaccharide deacetylase family protein [Cytobacillus suaedae]|nr:polysaccharide deacetylase family protein [Cytobacillus suaedae]